MKLETIRYDVDGRAFEGYLADGSGGRPVPGVLVAHEGPGLTEHPRRRARELAELGYVAFALDLYGEKDLPSSGRRCSSMSIDPLDLRSVFMYSTGAINAVRRMRATRSWASPEVPKLAKRAMACPGQNRYRDSSRHSCAQREASPWIAESARQAPLSPGIGTTGRT